MFTRLTVGIVVFTTLGASFALAQLPTGAISGTIRDSSAAAIPGATVTATNRETGLARTTHTSGEGYYKLPAMPVGVYDVKAEAVSFQPEIQQELRLAVGQEAVLNFTLTVGAVQETVTITAAAPLVETTNGSLGGLVNEERITELPLNGRNFNSLVLLQSGISIYKTSSATSTLGIGLAFSSNGAPIRSNFIMMDGANLVSFQGTTGVSVSGSMLGVDGIREFRVITNSFPAEYGMTMGSQMTIVSKGGTNSFHGTAFDFLRNSVLDARDFFDRKSNPQDPRLPPFRRNNFGGSFGGPVKKDTTFFFATYEGIRDFTGRSIPINVPTAAARRDGVLVPVVAASVKPYLSLYPLPNEFLSGDPTGAGGIGRYVAAYARTTREDFGQARADQNLSDQGNVFFRYTVTDANQTNPAEFPFFQDFADSRGQYVTLAENHTFSPVLLNLFRLSFSRSFQNFDSPSDPALGFRPGLQMGNIAPGSGVTGLGPIATRPNAFNLNVYTLSNDVFWNRGAHTIKLGTLMNRHHGQVTSGRGFKGTYAFANLTQFLLGVPRQLVIATPGAVPDRTFRWSTFGFYVQDDWRVTPRWTVNAGLRYEFTNTVSETSGRGASLHDLLHDTAFTFAPPLYRNPSRHNFGPRFGFAWDVTGNAVTSIRGGFGVLYDLANLASSASGSSPFTTQSTVTTNLGFPFTVIPPESAANSLRVVDYHLQQPHLLQYNLTVERRLPGEVLFSLSYGGSRGINLIQDKEGNPTWPSAKIDGRDFWIGNEKRLNPNLGTIDFKTAGSNSWYNSLQFTVRKQLSHGLQFQSSYAWSKSLDTTQGQQPGEGGGSNTNGTNPNHLPLDKGPSDFDTRHSWTWNALYRLPSPGRHGFWTVFQGWRWGAIFTAKSGLPFTPLLSGNRSRSQVAGAAADRPDLVPGRKPGHIILGRPERYFDPTAFSIQPVGVLGTASRNFLQGPGIVNWDFSLTKETSLAFLGESARLEFRAEIFNLMNRPNFNFPVGGRTVFTADETRATLTPLVSAGQIDRTVTSSRQVQLALKLVF